MVTSDVEYGHSDDSPASIASDPQVVVEDISEGTRREQEAKRKLDLTVKALVAAVAGSLGALLMWVLERFVV